MSVQSTTHSIDSYQSTEPVSHHAPITINVQPNSHTHHNSIHKRKHKYKFIHHGKQTNQFHQFISMETHRIISLINELVSIVIESIVYIGGVLSLIASFGSEYLQDTIECIIFWSLALSLITYIVGDLARAFRPFDEYDTYIRALLPKWISVYILGSKVTVALCTNELIKTGETALIYYPFYVPYRHVEHVSFLVGVGLSIVYALVSIKESTRSHDRQAEQEAEDELTDTTIGMCVYDNV